MSLSQITTLPVNTLLELATSGQFGLCPKLKSSISSLSGSSRNNPASELAIRKALDDIDTTINYYNVGTGTEIYNSLSGDVTALYNSLNSTGSYLTAFLSGNTIYLSGYGDTSPANIVSVQGGKYQYSETVQASAIQTTGYTIAYANEDDLIGKIFVKCITPVDDQSQTYSIGLDSNHDYYTCDFSAPTVEGLVTSWGYGEGLSGKEYDWIETDKEIKIFRSGTNASSGEIGVSIFYDSINWSPDYGYVMGYGDNDIYRMNLDNETSNLTNRASKLLYSDQYSSTSNNSYIYTAGGRLSVVYNNINRYNTKNDTVNSIDRGDLSISRRALISEKSSTKLYFIGGTNAVVESAYDVIDNIQFSNDTANAVANASLTSPRSSNGAVSNTTTIWTAGGYVSNIPAVSIGKMNFSTDTTTSSIAGTLNTASLKMSGEFKTNINGYFLPGHIAGSVINVLDKITFSTETVISTTDFWAVETTLPVAVQNTTNGWSLGGYNQTTGSIFNTIQKFNFSTGVRSIINNSIDAQVYGTRGSSV